MTFARLPDAVGPRERARCRRDERREREDCDRRSDGEAECFAEKRGSLSRQREPAEAGGDEDRDGQHSTREDSTRMIADNRGNESAVGTSAEDAYPQHKERRRRRQRHALQFAESVHSLRAIGIAEQRNEGDPDWKQRHQLLKPAPPTARGAEQP